MLAEVDDAVVDVGELWIVEPVRPLVCVAIELELVLGLESSV